MAAAAPVQPPINIPTATLCTIARADAVHDYGSGLDRGLLSETLPRTPIGCGDITDEDILIRDILGLSRIEGVSRFNDDSFNFKADYDIRYCDALTLDEVLRGYFGTELGFIVDTYTSDFKQFITGLRGRRAEGRNPGLKYFWIQNKETLYDPAGKTTPITDAGIDMFRGNPHIYFAWENNTKSSTDNTFGNSTLYGKCRDDTLHINAANEEDRNFLFYSKYTVTQLLKAANEENPSFESQKGNVLAVLTDSSDTHNIKQILVDDNAAEKNQALFQLASYKSLFTRYADILNSTLGHTINAPSEENFIDIVSKYKYVLKRLGDQGQALSCLRPQSVLYKPVPETTVLERKIFNKNIGFVTIDRPAMVAAILYRVPVIVFCFNKGGFAIFINKKYINPETMLINAKINYNTIYNLYLQRMQTILIMRNIYTILENLIYNKLEYIINRYADIIRTYITDINITNEQKDEHYREFMIDMFQYRYDMLNYYNNMIMGDMPAFEPPNRISEIHNIIDVNKALEKINRSYSRFESAIYNSAHTINRYIFRRIVDNVTYIIDLSIDGYDSNTHIKLKRGGETIIITHDEFRGGYILERNDNYAQDQLATEQLNALSLFQINRAHIQSERQVTSFINDKTGLPYIDEYLNALYMYRNNLFIPFKTVFDLLTQYMINISRDSPILGSVSKIMSERIHNNISWKQYEKLSRISGKKRGRNSDDSKQGPPKKARTEGGSMDDIIKELIHQEKNAMNNFLDMLDNFYKMELKKQERNHVYPISSDNTIYLEPPLLFINSTLYSIKQYADLYNRYLFIENTYKQQSSNIALVVKNNINIPGKVPFTVSVKSAPGGNENNEMLPPGGGNGRPRGNYVLPESGKMPYYTGVVPTIARSAAAPGGNGNNEMRWWGGGSYKPRKIQYNGATRKQKSRVKKTHKKKRV